MKTTHQQLEAIKDLYVLYRKKWLSQKADGTYHTENRYSLHDDRLKEHLDGKKTIGVFSGEEFTKFITFDVDYDKNMDKAQAVTKEIVLHLESEHHISRENMLVSFSGSKGYHIDLFFDKALTITFAKQFYKTVINELGLPTGKVEYRPTNGQGVKLPLSYNKKTNKKCHIVDCMSLKEVSDSKITKVIKIDTDKFKDNMVSQYYEDAKPVILETNKAVEFEEVLSKTELDIPVDYEERCIMMLQENQLIYPDSRHLSTFMLGIYLKEYHEYDRQTTISTITSIISNTFTQKREYISPKTTLEHALSEVERLVNVIHDKGYTFGFSRKKSIKIYENELLEVLEPKKMHLKQLLFILLVHSKKYAKDDGIFYMTYQQMNQMGATKERGRLLNYMDKLEKEGYVEIVQRNVRKRGEQTHIPNKYKVNITPNTENFIELGLEEKDIQLEAVVAKLLPEETVKGMVSKKQFYEIFKPQYKLIG